MNRYSGPSCKAHLILKFVASCIVFSGLFSEVVFSQVQPSDDSIDQSSSLPIVVPEHPTVVEYDDYRDPLEPVNRAIFAFNDVSYRYVLIPIAKGYDKAVPRAVRSGIRNVFKNLTEPISALNHLLQFKLKKSGQNLIRFGLNSTVGVAGIFDPASTDFGIPDIRANFEGTLMHYRVGYGCYLVLPFYGSSDLRNGVGRLGDHYSHPIVLFVDPPESTAISVFDAFQQYAPSAEGYLQLRAESDDPYFFFRNLYSQSKQRDAEYEATE